MEIHYLPNKNLIMLIPLNSAGCSAPRERIQSVLGTDKVVEIDTDNGKRILSYREFLRIKKSLPEEGWRVISLLTSLEEAVNEIFNKNNEL